MQYKLVFIKTHPSHLIAGIGVGGNVMMVMSMISNMTDSDSLYVDMETNEVVWTQKDAISAPTNAWEYFFVQKPLNPAKEVKTLSIQETGKINFRYEDDSIGEDLSLYKSWKNRFFANFSLNTTLQDGVNSYYNTHIKGRVTLGVQIRLTDQEYHNHTKGLEASITRIRQILSDNTEIEQIFLATDDETIFPRVINSVPIPVIYKEDIFRASEKDRQINPYDRMGGTRKNHRYLLGLECLQDIFILTKCDYLLKADRSAISIVACLLSENIRKVYTL